MSKTVYGYKDTASRVSFVVTGIVLLIAINLWVVVWIKDQRLAWWLLIAVVALGWIFWRMRRVYTKLRYSFGKEGITIHLPSGKKFHLSSDKIEDTQQIKKISPLRGWGIKYLFWKNEFHFTTSTSHLLKITMQDGRTIVISPKEYISE